MGETKIQWTQNPDGSQGKTWTPIRARNKVTGKVGWFCEHVSEGCRNCYAEKMNANTYFGNGLDYKPASLDQVELFLDEKILQQPLHWRKPTKVFPCSMTDLFGRWVTDDWLFQVFDVMRRCPQHTFQVLTKRADRMKDFCGRLRFNRDGAGRMWLAENAEVSEGGYRLMGGHGATGMPWVWMGVSVEDQKTADERLPLLLDTPAGNHWASVEPLLGPIHLCGIGGCCAYREYALDWIVIGGESGPHARPFDLTWARDILAQLKEADNYVAPFVKQLGANPVQDGEPLILKDKKGGDIEEWPTDLRVREFPSSVTTQDLSL